jgi:hypothetical protein
MQDFRALLAKEDDGIRRDPSITPSPSLKLWRSDLARCRARSLPDLGARSVGEHSWDRTPESGVGTIGSQRGDGLPQMSS